MLQNSFFSQSLLNGLNQFISSLPDKSLYKPVAYILEIGGKRIRPQLCLMSCKAFNGKIENALPLALAVEVFHNFSLVHDDIMDNAPLRRGMQTVHEKWNTNTAILSGDAMLILVYDLINQAPQEIAYKATKLINQVSLEVCEGQMSDMDFEAINNISLFQYIEMIRQKTAVLLGGALQLGAIAANANENQQKAIYNFGLNLGLAFQLKDDLLDAFGELSKVGKQIGGDIIANKKTFLYIKALELANEVDKASLENWFSQKTVNNTEKVNAVINLFNKYNIKEITQNEVDKYSKIAIENLSICNFNTDNNQLFNTLVNELLFRNA